MALPACIRGPAGLAVAKQACHFPPVSTHMAIIHTCLSMDGAFVEAVCMAGRHRRAPHSNLTARNSKTNKIFGVFRAPTDPLDPETSRPTGLWPTGVNVRRQMVPTFGVDTRWLAFIVESMPNPAPHDLEVCRGSSSRPAVVV